MKDNHIMSSILTNVSAMTALQSLNKTQASMETTQKRISTGYRVGSAEDNAAYWSIATTMRSDNSAMSTVKDALGLGAATIDVAYTATNSAIDVAKAIKDKLVAARQPGVDRTKIQSEVTQLQNQLKSIGDSAVFSGENWLSTDSSAAGYNPTKSIVSSFSRTAGNITIGTIAIDTSSIKLYDANGAASPLGIIDGSRDATGALSATGTFSVANLNIATLTDNAADTATLQNYIVGVDKSISEMTSSASTLGATKQRVTLQTNFVTALMDAVERGISTLIDADMSHESTKLQALQVQQQLGVQSLSIANQNNQSILSLFK
jgi:flagellin